MKASDYINYLVNGETYKLAVQDVGDLDSTYYKNNMK